MSNTLGYGEGALFLKTKDGEPQHSTPVTF